MRSGTTTPSGRSSAAFTYRRAWRSDSACSACNARTASAGDTVDQQLDRPVHPNRVLVGERTTPRHQPLEYYASRQTPSRRPPNRPLKLEVCDCVGAVISPLLSNIYLHALDRAFADGVHGTLVRYADDFVVACAAIEATAARRLAGEVLAGLGLELHPEKTRVVDLREGREGFDFLGCHFRARVSGRMLERGIRRYYLHRWPSVRAMKRIRAGSRRRPPKPRGKDIRDVIERSIRSCAAGATTFAPGTPLRSSTRSTATSSSAARFDGNAMAATSKPGMAGLDAQVVRGSRTLPACGHHSLSGIRVVTIRKIIGKPCAGKPHARIERGMGKRA